MLVVPVVVRMRVFVLQLRMQVQMFMLLAEDKGKSGQHAGCRHSLPQIGYASAENRKRRGGPNKRIG